MLKHLKYFKENFNNDSTHIDTEEETTNIDEIIDEFKDILENIKSNESESYEWGINICDGEETYQIKRFIEDKYGTEGFIVIDEKDVYEYCEKIFQEYSCDVDSWLTTHGFIFEDGSVLNTPADDHRIIDIDLWYKENIITVHILDKELTLRLNHNKTNNKQKNTIKRHIKLFKIDSIKYDIYRDDKIINSGSIYPYMIDNII